MSKENPATVLVVDDDQDLRYSLRRVLSQRGYRVEEAESGEEGLKKAEACSPQVILLDNRMPGMSGLEALQHLRGVVPKVMIILMTAYGTTQTTIEAMKFGAFDYVMKPFDPKKIVALTEAAVSAATDLDRAERTQAETRVSNEELEGGIIGTSQPMQDVFKLIGQVAASDVTVMITGESGTGKELVARAIYQHSLRTGKPFMAVNCAAIPENLIESELFGHEKGSFTGATNQRTGKFEQCDGGTIFLDEIGDMALPTQTKILRALQEGEIQRVGGSETKRVDVRLIAATNKPLEKMVQEKTFREDLYYRLNVVRIQLPPLRERPEDIPPLVEFVLKRLARGCQSPALDISPEALRALTAYRWPGNVRELENAVHRSAVVAQGDTILLRDLPAELVASAGITAEPKDPAESGTDEAVRSDERPPLDRRAAFDTAYRLMREERDSNLLEQAEREIIRRALKETGGNQVKASGLLGITRATLRKRIDQYDLQT
jgi:two-component system nitrogen regulation response regulator GlnG